MSWRFASITFRSDHSGRFPELLQRLGVRYHQSAPGFTFDDAIRWDNKATAVGLVNGRTMVLEHFLPYDCSFEPGKTGRLDPVLMELSVQEDILCCIVDGGSGTYCLAAFHKGQRVRCWAAEPGRVLCQEGQPVEGEEQDHSARLRDLEALPAMFTPCDNELRVLGAWEHFLGVSFQDLVRSEEALFHFFL